MGALWHEASLEPRRDRGCIDTQGTASGEGGGTSGVVEYRGLDAAHHKQGHGRERTGGHRDPQ